MRTLLIVLSTFALVAPSASAADSLGRTLEALFAVEARLLNNEVDRYLAARNRERRSQREARELAEQIDQRLSRRTSRLSRLENLVSELTIAREVAAAYSRTAALLLSQVLERMERLEELNSEIEQQFDHSLVETEDLEGLWSIEMTEHGPGLMGLRLDGTLVTGTYRLNSGAQGSLRGTYVDHRLTLERIDTRGGFVSTLEADHDTGTGELVGIWQLRDVSLGQLPYGEWTGRKLAPSEIQNGSEP